MHRSIIALTLAALATPALAHPGHGAAPGHNHLAEAGLSGLAAMALVTAWVIWRSRKS